MPTTKRDEMLAAIRANTQSMDRLNKTMAATIEALLRHTDIQVGEGEPVPLDENSELVKEMFVKLMHLFEATSTDGVLRPAAATLIMEPRNAEAVGVALDVMLDEGYLEDRDGMLYKREGTVDD